MSERNILIEHYNELKKYPHIITPDFDVSVITYGNFDVLCESESRLIYNNIVNSVSISSDAVFDIKIYGASYAYITLNEVNFDLIFDHDISAFILPKFSHDAPFILNMSTTVYFSIHTDGNIVAYTNCFISNKPRYDMYHMAINDFNGMDLLHYYLNLMTNMCENNAKRQKIK
jgi:hypothetical protein